MMKKAVYVTILKGLERDGAVSGSGLSTSPEGFVLTPLLYQTHVLWELHRCLFSRRVSCLDAFSTYPKWRSCPAYLAR